MIYVQVLNHGMTPDDLDPHRGAKLATIAARIRKACLDFIVPGGHEAPPEEVGEVTVDMPFNATLGGGQETPLIVLADILAWPPAIVKLNTAEAYNRVQRGLAKAIGEDLAKFFASGRKIHVRVRIPVLTDTTWTR